MTEGYTDCTFIRKLTKHRGLDSYIGADRTSREPGGLGMGSGGYLATLEGLRGWIELNPGVIKGIVLMADCDDDPSGQFIRARDQIANAGFPTPSFAGQVARGEVADDRLAVSVLMIPKDGESGNLDSLLLGSLPNDEAMRCAVSLMECNAARNASWAPRKRAEALLRVAICGFYGRDPGRDLAHLIMDKKTPFDMSHPVFDHIDRYLRDFLRAIGVIGHG